MAHRIRVARDEPDDDGSWATMSVPFGVPAIAALEAADGGAGESVWPHAVHPDEEASGPRVREIDGRSHGESFFDLFQSRVHGAGLYLLDEPESPLSPRRQLAFLALMGDAVRDGARFVIATHSPVLLAYPDARIYSFDEPPVREVPFAELEHVTVTRDLLQAPERYLRQLM